MKSIRWKIILLCVLVLLVPLLLLNHYTLRTFSEFSGPDLEKHMIDSAFLVGEQYKAALGGSNDLDEAQSAWMTAALVAYGRQIRARIQVLSPAGVVRLDSSTNADNAVNADLSARPEVDSARKGKYRARFELTSDHNYMFYYVAYPEVREQTVCAVIYLSRHTSNIVRAINRMAEFQRLATGAALLAGVALAAVLAHSLTSRLRRLTAAATAFAAGGAPPDMRVGGSDEIAELSAAIRQMVGEIQRTNRYNLEFISALMHELRAPITSIRASAEVLEDGAFREEQARVRFLGNIRNATDRLARLVSELNEMTKLDADVSHAPKEKVDYGRCVGEIVERIELALDPGHAPIRVTPPPAPVHARVVPGRIEQVLGNLIDNAVRYTPASGAIDIKVEPRADGTVLTSVRDTGCGISPANIGKVFDRFFTTEPGDTPKDYGSGLGLAIAKTIVESHHGRIWVESVPGQGAVFFFTLPAAEA